MKVGVVQLNPTVGDFRKNVEKINRFLSDCRKEKAELVVFPELSICGYPPRDLLDYESFLKKTDKAIEEIAAASRGMTVVCGAVTRNSEKVGKPLFNAAVVLEDGKRAGEYHKRLLPYYDVFDEPRYFEEGNEGLVLSVGRFQIALSICEDAWNFPGFLKRLHPRQPLEDYRDKKIDLLLNLSASPYSLGKSERRLELFHQVSKYLNCPAVFCDQVGGNDDLIFDGCSFVTNASGDVVVSGSAFKEECIFFDLEKLPQKTIPAWPKKDSEWLVEALTLGIFDYFEKCGMKKAVIGLSGGIDSSVTAALAVRSLGAKNVVGISLPTRFTSEGSRHDAKELAKNLKIEFFEMSIDSLFTQFQNETSKQLGVSLSGVSLENVQPRLRMTVLMAMANERKALLLNTSNKSEIATAFATQYGDSSGALAVLGDLTKRQVYEVAKELNQKERVIPETVIERVPSAELKADQKDEDVLPPYKWLDVIVSEHIENTKEIVDSKIPKAAFEKFLALHKASEFKRRQLPPPLRISQRGFGIGRRIPIAATYPVD